MTFNIYASSEITFKRNESYFYHTNLKLGLGMKVMKFVIFEIVILKMVIMIIMIIIMTISIILITMAMIMVTILVMITIMKKIAIH